MKNVISIKNLSMIYEYYEKEKGIKGSLKNFFLRKKLHKTALNDISLDIEEGSITGYVGLNGAGKTTTMKILSGILNPTKGSVSVLGYNPYDKKSEFLKQIGIVMGNKSQLMWDLPAIDSIELNKSIYEVSDEDYDALFAEMVETLHVSELLHIQVRRLSLGERMKMELIASLIHRPKVVFLDEPTIGLDIISQNNIRDFLKLYNKKYGATIIITSHNFDDISEVCNKLIIIEHGNLVFNGFLNEFYEKYRTDKIFSIRMNHSDINFLSLLKKKLGNDCITYDENNNDYKILIENESLLSVIKVLMEDYMNEIQDINITNRELKDIVCDLLEENA